VQLIDTTKQGKWAVKLMVPPWQSADRFGGAAQLA
jgi:hypothetical protein